MINLILVLFCLIDTQEKEETTTPPPPHPQEKGEKMACIEQLQMLFFQIGCDVGDH